MSVRLELEGERDSVMDEMRDGVRRTIACERLCPDNSTHRLSATTSAARPPNRW